MSSGYRITYTGFLPCSNQLADMLRASGKLESLRAAMAEAGLVDIKRADLFVRSRKAASGPSVHAPADSPSSPDPQAPAQSDGEQSAASQANTLAEIGRQVREGIADVPAEELLDLTGTVLDRRRPA
jgi:hypothetical protein